MKAFYAYPSEPEAVGHVITAAAKHLLADIELVTWQENDIAGRPLIDPILEQIDTSDALLCDITRLNFNVTFEIGYAVAKNKRLIITRNSSFKKDDLIDLVGIFDTLGYKEYQNSVELLQVVRKISATEALLTNYPLNRRAPVYVIETPRRDELTLTLISKVKKARLKYRSFNPGEDVRLSAIDAIKNVVSSFGIVIPLLSKEMDSSEIHNIRAAFVAGLSVGFGLPYLIVQHFGGPIALDVRDFARTIKHPDDIKAVVNEFALEVTERFQNSELEVQAEAGLLAAISFGDPKAEDEFETIDAYFLQTDQYLKAERGEVYLIVGRKGTGKTAIFGHLRNRKRADPLNVVLDLKPEGYQLVKMREQILRRVNEGAKQHLIVAFWEYVLLLELCNKLLEKDKQRHLTDHRLFELYNRLKTKYGDFSKFMEADFSERLLLVSDHVIGEYQKRFGAKENVDLSTGDLTNLLYQVDLRELRVDLSDYLKFKKQVFVLFDNLDTGWPEGGLSSDDILVMRCLLDASKKIQREMRALDHQFSCVVFLRNDVYQLLIRTTADFGKDLRAQLDWTDSDQIREMVRLRMVQGEANKELSFETVWRRICVSHVQGEESSQYLIDRSLYRPRNVLKLLYHCRAAAINVGKNKIDQDDIFNGVGTFSTDMVIEANREISSVMPRAHKKIYNLVDESASLALDELEILMRDEHMSADEFENLISYMIFFGTLGLERDGRIKYIWDVGYDMDMIAAERQKFFGAIRFAVNPAFWPQLRIHANA